MAIYTAASCSFTDVQAVADSSHNAALVDGDTVIIPSGTCQWTDVTLNITKAINLQGAVPCTLDGNGRPTACSTVIQDNTFKSTPCPGTCLCNRPTDNFRGAPIINFSSTTDQNISWRWHDFAIVGQQADQATCSNHVQISSMSHTFRLDHIYFNPILAVGFNLNGDMRGVMDHIRVGNPGDANHKGLMYCGSATSWNGVGDFGDNSWAVASSFGTTDAVVLEDIQIYDDANQGAGLIDGAHGCRVVIRHSLFSFIGTHGTESTRRQRSMRQMEIYQNNITSQPNGDASVSLIRGGTGVMWGNTIRCLNNDCNANPYGELAKFENDRDTDAYVPWGQCNGTTNLDNNNPTLFFSGNVTAGGTNDLLTDTNKNFGNLAGGDYVVRNTTKGWASTVISSTATTVTTRAPLFVAHAWAVNDAYQIGKVYPCLDQVGRGKGDLLSGGDASTPPTQTAWPNQTLEPWYQWNNSFQCPAANSSTACGSAALNSIITTPLLSPSAEHVIANRDYYDNVQKPGYAPLVYPHPLVGGVAATPQHHIPTILTVG